MVVHQFSLVKFIVWRKPCNRCYTVFFITLFASRNNDCYESSESNH